MFDTRVSNVVVLEGIDGSGTTTQARRLAERIRAAGRRVWVTSEPTGGEIGRLIRQVLAGEIIVHPNTTAHLYAADRSEHVYGAGGIVQRAEAGEVVVCDRYVYSSLAYQGLQSDPALIARLNESFPRPALAVFIDVPVEVTSERLARRRRREIFEYEAFQRDVRDAYLRLFDADPDSSDMVTIDGTESEDAVAEKIWELVGQASILEA